MGTYKENIGDLLSAKAIALLGKYDKPKFYCLPRDIGLSAQEEVIYGGGGMLRPSFYFKEYKDYILRSPSYKYYIYGVGINVDIKGDKFSRKSIKALRQWLENAESISVRDNESKRFVEDRFNVECSLSPCPSYSVLKSIKSLRIKKKYYLGIVAGFGHTKTYLDYLDKIVGLIKGVIREIGEDNTSIICHDFQDFQFAQKNFGANVDICKPSNFKEVKSVYSRCINIISLRGHGIIFAAANNLPCSFVPLNLKLKSLYFYHYGYSGLDLIFNCRVHLEYLDRKLLPRDINVKFNI